MQCMVETPVQERRKRMVEIVLEAARGRDVDHQERAVRASESAMPGEHVGRVGLVVDGVEGGDEVVRAGLVECGRVPRPRSGRWTPEPRPRPRRAIAGLGEVDSR